MLYEGRFRPAEAYGHLWLYEHYHATTLKKRDLTAFHASSTSPLQFLWALEFSGYLPYQNTPLFWIGSVALKNTLKLPTKQDHFSYQELQHLLTLPIVSEDKKVREDWSALLTHLKAFKQLHGMHSPLDKALKQRLSELQASDLPSKEIGRLLEQEYPLKQRLENGGQLFKALPSRYQSGDWLPLKALTTQVYHPPSQQLKAVDNFTLFSDAHFELVRQAYINLEKAYLGSDQDKIKSAERQMAQTLYDAYQPLAGTSARQAHEKRLTYPSTLQLKVETWYVQYPWIPFLIFLYGVAGVLLIFYRQQGSLGHYLALSTLVLAILSHTILLAMRCFILERAPVSNMFETVLYVPWIAACATLLHPTLRKHPLALLSTCLTSIILLVILEVTDLNQNLNQVQAVLDSQFWLLIHVLLVVGSYGLFILGAILGHFYLGMFIAQRQETLTMKHLSSMILQTLYGGTTLLITGTILGGVWAAESWGRFWDWDPKESWAFISSCFYLIWIHAYRFHRIASFGLAIGAVSGFFAISFTWYGVNYILGTGLHSYGFGSGGEHYYYAFLIGECLFLTIAFLAYKNSINRSFSHLK